MPMGNVGSAVIPVIVGGVITVVGGFMASSYNSELQAQQANLSSQSAELREHDRAISQLQETVKAVQAQELRLESTISDISSAETKILSAITELSDGSNETKREMENLRRSLDALNDIIRPVKSYSGSNR